MLPQTEAILIPPKKNALGQLFQSAFTMPELLKGGKIPSIDGLRAIAILWVIGGHIKHSLNNSSATFNALDIVFGVGQLGVKFFFVISGFLITTLLIKEKLRTSTIDLKKFYIRRFLRIFPVYYLYLAVILVLNFSCGMGISGTTFILAALYLTNFNMSSYNWSLMHSWSLSVEEQYYLLWPTIFKLNAKLATRLAIICIMLGPVIRVVVYYYPSFTNKLLAPLFTNADSIFIGSLLSIACCKGVIDMRWFYRHKRWLNFAGFPFIWLISFFTLHGMFGKILLPFGPTMIALAFAAILISHIKPSTDLLFQLLNSKLLSAIGILSYSIYVWQQLFLLAPEGFPSKTLQWNTIPVNLCLVAVVSTASYYLYERYFLRLKSTFKA